ncbi:hypothetical protein NP493_5358g00000, partial [Ridgeia piscesae]
RVDVGIQHLSPLITTFLSAPTLNLKQTTIILSERQQLGQCYSDNDDDSDSDSDSDKETDEMVALSGAALCRGQPRDTKEAERWRYKSKLVQCRRRQECSDEGAQMLYANVNSSSSKFAKK